ncbi:MAG: response regulator [Mucilaginibacter sp.]
MNKFVIIDDDPIDHFLMQHIMQDINYFDETTYTMDGLLVLEYIEENKDLPEALPDVILVDLNMPHFSGWDFLDRYSDISVNLKKDIKVYILSSSVRPADKERSKSYPFIRSFISKPLDESVIAKIKMDN